MSKMITKHPYCWTFTGKKFFPMAPAPDQISIVDLANGLGREVRFGNQADVDYTVAQHSVQIARIADQLLRAAGEPEHIRKLVMLQSMLHDGSEYVSGDVPKPCKEAFGGISVWEDKVNSVIFESFGLDYAKIDPIVKHIDGRIVIDEALSFFKYKPDWAIEFQEDRIGLKLKCWDKAMSSIIWLRMTARLMGWNFTHDDAIKMLRLEGTQYARRRN